MLKSKGSTSASNEVRLAEIRSTDFISRRVVIACLSGLMILGSSLMTQAAVNGSEPTVWAGAMGGVLIPNKSGTSARGDLGLTAGAMLGSEFAIGGYYLTSKKSETSSVGTFDLDFYGIEGSYHFEGEARGAYFGARMGITKMNFGVAPSELTASPFHFGAIAGYNKWLGENLSIGADLALYSVSKGEATSLTGLPSTVDSFTALTFLATLKLWL